MLEQQVGTLSISLKIHAVKRSFTMFLSHVAAVKEVTYCLVLIPSSHEERQHQSFQQMHQNDMFKFNYQSPLVAIVIMTGVKEEVT